MKTLVKVVIPFYKANLKDWESAALKQIMNVLGKHPIVFLKPEGLAIDTYTDLYPQAETMSVSADWLGTHRGIAGYNEMMMSKAFYDLFSDTEYILICHTDAWIFHDALNEWCQQGYDLVAAPWPMRPRYNHFPFKQFLQLKKMLCTPSHGISRLQMYGKIGNGGLCLRKVAAFSQACERYAKEITYFNNQPDSMHNEDIFWALIPQDFHYSSVESALQFAFDLKPRVCYQLTHNQLPMGCHGFNHKSRIKFWEKFIPCIKDCKEW